MVLGQLVHASVGVALERVRILEHVRFGKFRAEWVDESPKRVDVVHAMDVLSPWEERRAFAQKQRRRAKKLWDQIDAVSVEYAERWPTLPAQANSVRAQWSKTKDADPGAYYRAGWDLLRRFGFTTDAEGRVVLEGTRAGSVVLVPFVLAFLVVSAINGYQSFKHPPRGLEPSFELGGYVLSLVLAALTAIQTRRWIRAHTKQ